MKKISVNQFNKGLNLDNNPVSVSNDSLIGALNATFITKNGNEVVLQNDMGNASVDKAQLPAGYVPIGAKEHGGIIYVASYNPLTDKSQIGCFPSPQRNFATDSDKSLGFKNLCEYDGNTTFEQKIVEISDDNIIRPGDKFIITATENQIADFENYSQYIRLKVLIITSDNQSIDITNELVEPSGHFEHVKFVKNIENDIQDTDYTIYSNKTCGQLCLRAELIIPSKIELSYSAEYKKISELFPNDYQTKISNWINWSTNHDDSPITPGLINQDTYVTNLHVKVTPYDEYGNIFDQNTISGYESNVTITDGHIYNYLQSNQGDFYYLVYGESDNSIINFNYTPQYIYPPSSCQVTIYPLKKSEQVEFSLIGSGKVTFNTFRYFNDFDNNHLVLNYGLKFYQRNSDYKLTDLYLELINLRDLNNNNWSYNNDLGTKISLNIENTFGVYTETIDYYLILNNLQAAVYSQDKIVAGQYYLARICAEVNETTLYKGDWHALLTSEATNYLYNDGKQNMLKLDSQQNNLLLNYNIIKNNISSINNHEELTDESSDNYFVIQQPQNGDVMRYEIKKYGNITYTHKATAELILPKYFPFSKNEISYNPQMQCYIPEDDFSVIYQDDIIVDGTYTPNDKVKHYNDVIIKNGQNIGGNNNTTIAERNGKNKLFYEYNDSGDENDSVGDGIIQLSFDYELYSQLISPLVNQGYVYDIDGPTFVSYSSRLEKLLKSSCIINISNDQIYPRKMLYCIYSNDYGTIIGVSDYINPNNNSMSYYQDPQNTTQHIKSANIYYCNSFEISEFLNQELEYPNIVIFSSCVDQYSKIYKNGRNNNNPLFTYDMMLMKGVDENLYLITDINDTKGELLKNFNSLFENIYVCKLDENISLTYWKADPTNYFATNDYKIYLDYNISYLKSTGADINVNNYDTNAKTLDGETIYLPHIKFNDVITTEHYRQTISASSISEKVSNFLNGTVIIENVAKIVNYADGLPVSTSYKLVAYDGNKRTPLNTKDCYILENDNLINCKDYSNTNSQLYNISQKIKNKKLVLNDYYELVLNNDIIPSISNSPPYWAYGTPSNVYLTTIFPNNNFKNFKLLE